MVLVLRVLPGPLHLPGKPKRTRVLALLLLEELVHYKRGSMYAMTSFHVRIGVHNG